MAAQLEMFGVSKRELERKFTKSEQYIIGWRSQEVAANMEKITESAKRTAHQEGPTFITPGEIPEGLPSHFFRKDYDPDAGIGPGELDLRQVRGEEAYKFFQSMGVKLPIMTGRGIR